MQRKAKGINAERELVRLFWERGWPAVRVAASGATKNPSVDVLTGTPERKLAIEAKTTKDRRKYFSAGEIAQLTTFASKFGVEPWVAVKFAGEQWYFIAPNDLRKTEKGLCVTVESAKQYGVIIDELIVSAK